MRRFLPNDRIGKDPQTKVASSTVVKALHVLDALAELNAASPDGVSVSEIARLSDEHASSVCKHLAAFQQFGLVDQDPVTERYRIGIYALRLSSTLLRRINIRDIALPFLRKLTEQTGETVHLVVQDKTNVVYLEKTEPPKAVRMHSQVGLTNPMYCTGVGKAILAYSPSSLLEEVLQEELRRFTPKTLTTKEELLSDLERIRVRGFAIDDEERDPDVRCVAAPVFDHQGVPHAAISVSAPKWRFTDERLEEIGPLVRSAAHELSLQLGFR